MPSVSFDGHTRGCSAGYRLAVHGPARLIASGRDSDIFEHGPRSVLRRSRHARSMKVEARAMEHARSHGYPVPAVEDISADGTELVMERVNGRSMFTPLARQPWAMKRYAAILAGLHDRLHEVPGPDWLPAAPGSAGDRMLHLDLHPLNVVLSPTGPVVIDWANVARGCASVDVAATWVLLAAAGIPSGRARAALLGRLRVPFVNAFLGHFDVAPVRRELPATVDWKVRDPNMSTAEQAAMRRLAASRP
jgi:aminoglycoside phosphotransferase (APT) family kinase protein